MAITRSMASKSFKRKRTRVAVQKEGSSNNLSTITDSQTLMPFFSIDIWFEILSWLSSTWLRSTMSRVCKTWNTMIRQPYFVEKNLLRSKSSNYIIRNQFGVSSCIDLYYSYLESRRLNYLPGVMHSTSQGLCIFIDDRSYYVLNPVTQQQDKISHINGLFSPQYEDFSYSAVRDRRSGEVKLVLACLERYQRKCSWYVQKLGTKDSWKTISKGKIFGQLEFPGISIAGFLIYILRNDIVVLDVSLETIHRIHDPTINDFCPVTYLQMGTNVLSCISHDSGRLYIHVLNEFLAGNWSLYKILDYGNVCGESPENHQFLGWIRNIGESSRNSHEELFVRCTLSPDSPSYKFSHDSCKYFTYNLKTKRISSLHGVDYSWKYVEPSRVWVHTPSLLSW